MFACEVKHAAACVYHGEKFPNFVTVAATSEDIIVRM